MQETDPRDLLLDRQNDLVLEDGDFQFSKGIAGVIQECRVRLQMFQGEWFLNLDAGIPYWTEIMGQKPSIAISAAAASFNEALLSIEDVFAVTKMEVTYDHKTRALTVNWAVRCAFGTTPVDVLKI